MHLICEATSGFFACSLLACIVTEEIRMNLCDLRGILIPFPLNENKGGHHVNCHQRLTIGKH